MNFKYKPRTNIRRIHSLQDLHSERVRLNQELSRTEEGISSNYHHILDAFTFHNLLNTITHDIALASTVFSKALSFGKKLIGKTKKKKKKQLGNEHGEIKQIDQPPDLPF
jgi:hypothetical protein